MPLSASEVSQVKHYLGYEQTQDDGWISAGVRGLDDRVSRLESNGVTRAQALLTELASLDTSITEARARLKAVQVGELRINGRRELASLRAERIKVAQSLARLLGVEYRGEGGSGQVCV